MYILTYSSKSQEALSNYKEYLNHRNLKSKLDFVLTDLPKEKRIITLAKSPHVDKKAKEAFEFILYQFSLIIYSSAYNCRWFNYLKSNVPELIQLKWKFVPKDC